MSSNEEEDDKITVLFPDDQDDDASDDVDDESRQEDADDEAADGERQDDQQNDELDGDEEATSGDGEATSPADGESAQDSSDEDNVVRLDFQDKSGDPETAAGGGDRRPIEELQSGEGVDSDRAKFEVFRRMIEEGMVMVTLDTRIEGVEVPPKFEGLPELRLNFSHMFHIDDFDYDAEGVRASLSFDGSRYFCDVPWEAVFMLYSHESGDVVVFEPTESEDSGDVDDGESGDDGED